MNEGSQGGGRSQDMRTYQPDDILCKVDRAAMAVSLETRSPFLDPGVFSASARFPSQTKIRYGKSKWAMRQILYRYVPTELSERPKTGFGIPVGDWLRDWAKRISGRRDRTDRPWIDLTFMTRRARKNAP